MTRDRLLVSITLALLIHAVVFVLLQLFLRFRTEQLPEYTGPMFVMLEEEPAVKTAAEPAPVVQAPQQPEARIEAPAPSAQPLPKAGAQPAPSQAAIRTVQPADQAPPLPKGPALRMEGARREEPQLSRPVGEGFQVPSQEPTIPPSGVQAGRQGSASEIVKPQGPSEQGPTVALDKLDKTLAQTRPGATTAAGAAAGTAAGTGAPARPGAGAAATTPEGIPIYFDDPAVGREPTYTPRPNIPDWVSRQGLRLTVEVTFVLTPQGVLQNVKVEKGSGYSDVDTAVLDALRRWKFKPVASTANVRGLVPYLIVPR